MSSPKRVRLDVARWVDTLKSAACDVTATRHRVYHFSNSSYSLRVPKMDLMAKDGELGLQGETSSTRSFWSWGPFLKAYSGSHLQSDE